MTEKNKNRVLLGALLICVGCAAIFSGCGSTYEEESAQAEMANPFIDCETIEDAQGIAGFLIDVPEDLKEWGYEDSWIQAVDDYLIQVCYLNKDEQILVRKGKGEADVSGDYNTYSYTETIELNGLEIERKGDGNTFNLATWTSGGYSYSIYSTIGMEPTELDTLIVEVK